MPRQNAEAPTWPRSTWSTHEPLEVRPVGVEDGARVLHAAELRRGLDMRELLVRKRPDEALHRLNDLGRAAERDGVGVGGIFRVGPHLDRDEAFPIPHRTMYADGEVTRCEDHSIGRNRMTFVPPNRVL